MFGNIVTFVVVRLYESFFTSRHDAMVWKVFQRRRPDPRDSGREYVKAIKYVLKTSDSTHMALRCRFFCNERFGEFLALLHLVLRALDTVEDDISKSVETRVADLSKFHLVLQDPVKNQLSCLYGMTDKERDLMTNMPTLHKVFSTLDVTTRQIIIKVTTSMATGMIKYLGNAQIDTFQDLEEYCFYVCGVLQRGFWEYGIAEGMEEGSVHPIGPRGPFDNPFATAMLVQEVHILSSFLEDTLMQPNPSLYLPKCLVQKYVLDQRDLLKEENLAKGVACINEYISHTLTHILPSFARLDEMRTVPAQMVYRCIILLDVAHLVIYYGNEAAFKYTLIPDLLEAIIIFEGCTGKKCFFKRLRYYCVKLLEKVGDGEDETGRVVIERINEIMAECDKQLKTL
ncbi:squalene synthase 8-like [Folsomia candida]|nr:squalene synthase 8-like [Folsomia candida]